MKKLTLSDKLILPIDAITQRISILGRTGSGKSHTAGVLVEEVLKAHQQAVIIDPKGDWWGLRSSADGKSAGLPITIMGGEHGDIPLEPTAGSIVADIIINEGISVVLDLSLFESKAQEIRFVEAFMDRLYRKNRKPMLLVVDEADIFAPQKPEKNETTMLNRMETVCRRGRSKGIGVVLISQRSASIHKGCLSQTEVMVAHQTTSPQDRKAIELWMNGKGDEGQQKTFIESLPSLETGKASVWSPSWLNIFRLVKIRSKETFDSSATPRVGMRRRAPKVLASVDLERLKQHMAATIEKAKQEDPKLLKIEISKLQAALKFAQKVTVQPGKVDPVILKRELEKWKKTPQIAVLAPKLIEKPIILKKEIDRLEKLFAEACILANKQSNAQNEFKETLHKLSTKIGDAEENLRISSRSTAELISDMQKGRDPKKPHRMDGPIVPLHIVPAGPARELLDEGKQPIVDGERRILVALENFKGRSVTKSQLAVLCGIKAKGTTLATYISRLKRRGFITQSGDCFNITRDGVAYVGVSEEMTPDKVQSMWLNRFHSGPRDILSRLIELYPDGVNMNVIAGELGLKEGGTTLATYISRLRASGLITVSKEAGDKFLKASKDLFEVTA